MDSVLLVEKSAVLCHSLCRELPSYLSIHCVRSFQEALECLLEGDFDVFIIGCPMQNLDQFDNLLEELSNDKYAEKVSLLLCERKNTLICDWVDGSFSREVLLWSDYQTVSQVLQGLIENSTVSIDDNLKECGDDSDIQIRVLLVDDSATIRRCYGKILTANNYQVVTAESVESGYQLAIKFHFDIAIIDYFMTDGTGDVLCKRLADDPLTSHITTSILTGTYLERVIADSLNAGAVECMFKNESEILFLARVSAMSRAVLDRRSIETDRRYFEGILDSVGDGVYGVDQLGSIRFVNPAARHALGIDVSKSLEGITPNSLFHYSTEDGNENPPETCFLTQAYAIGEKISDWQTTFWHSDGQSFCVEGTVIPLIVDGDNQGSVVAFRDVSERKVVEEELRWQANHDALTHLLNRNYFDQELHQEVNRARRTGRCSALVYIDLDQFKFINDTAGHAAGDQLLIDVAKRLKSRIRGADTLARLGGDEFAIILRNINHKMIYEVADTFRNMLAEHTFFYGDKHYCVNGSVGVALIDASIQSPGEVMANADLAAHIAKEKGRNQTHVYDSNNELRNTMDRELGWSARLNKALKEDAFELLFQPVIACKALDGAIKSSNGSFNKDGIERELHGQELQYEVLIRLLGDQGQLILPGAFMSAAERFGLLSKIDRWVIEQSFRRLSGKNDLPENCSLAINLSAQSITDQNLAGDIIDLHQKYRINPQNITFEFSETTAASNLEAAIALIRELKIFGFSFALDEFGNSFSSLSQIKFLDVDYIKIDGAFIKGVNENSLDREVVVAINQIAHSLGKKTVAEFVETHDQLDQLLSCGVDYAQGYLASKTGPQT